MKKKAKNKLTKRDIVLLEEVIAALDLMAAVSSTIPSGIARTLRNKFRNKRNREWVRFPEHFKPSRYSYGSAFFREFKKIATRFVNNPRLGNEYDKRRMITLAEWSNALLKNCLKEEAESL